MITKNKICPNPKCKSKNIISTGDSTNDGGDMNNNGSYKLPTIAILKCNDCEKKFKLKNKNF